VFVGEFATSWLDRMPKLDRPLFMKIGFPGPHPPFAPTPEYAEQYLDRELPEPKLSASDLNG
jgi:hypothetical protein